MRSAALISLFLISVTSCEKATEPVDLCLAVEIASSDVAPIPGNVLGAIVTVRGTGTDSVGLRYGLAGESLDSLAPGVAVSSPLTPHTSHLPVFGLLPEREYVIRATAYGACGNAAAQDLQFSTGPLPGDLPSYRVSGADPSPGYVVVNSGSYGVVIDNTGRVVWYHRFPTGTGLNFQAQANGHYVARPPAASPQEPGQWVEIDPLGAVVRTAGCANGLTARFHDLIVEADGSYWTMCDDVRTIDLTALGGMADARVMGTAIQRLSASGALLFEWSPFDHFALTDLPLSERGRRDVNWTHGNALDLDQDGNLIVSFRNLNELTKIDTRTGAVIWRMGGLANQFTWEEMPTPAFAGQHGLRATGAGELLVLDNLGQTGGSRAERYRYDEVRRTVRLLRAYETDPGVVAQVGGTTQNLPNGRTLVAFGNGGRLMEYDANGNVVWRIEGDAGYIFRAQRIRSLYHPGTGGTR